MSSLTIRDYPSSFLQACNTDETLFHPKRLKITLLGRFMRETKEEYPCRLEEISLFELSLLSSIQPKVGERIVCLIDHVGLIEGHVERHLKAGFLLSITSTSHGRKLLASRLQRLNLRDHSCSTSIFYKETSRSLSTGLDIFLHDNEKSKCYVEDLSLFGAFLLTQAKPPLGSEIYLNQIRGRVEEQLADGIRISFRDMTKPKAFRRYFDRESYLKNGN